MHKLWLLLVPVVAMAQLTPNSVTVTVSRTLDATVNQAQFSIAVHAGLEASLDDVIAVVRGVGLSAANFAGVGYGDSSIGIYNGDSDRPVAWYFNLSVPLTQMKTTIALMTAMQTSLAKDTKYSLSFGVSSASTTSSGCPLADMIAEARTSASKLASAAGLSAGGILAVSSPTLSPAANGGGYCSLTLKFSLGGI